jgi:hypothetical protein
MFTAQPKKYVTDAWNIGMRRVNRIIDDEDGSGYPAWATGTYSHLPDILVINYERALELGESFVPIVRVYEVTNYAKKEEYVQLDRGKRYLNTLLFFSCEKIFVCSYEENLRYLPNRRKYFEQHGIEVRVIGYQD